MGTQYPLSGDARACPRIIPIDPYILTSLQCSKAAYMSTALLNTRVTQGQRSGSLRDSLVASEGAERGIWEQPGRGGGMQWSAVMWCGASPIRPAGARTQVVPRRPYSRCSTGRCLRRCRRLHRAPARHSRYLELVVATIVSFVTPIRFGTVCFDSQTLIIRSVSIRGIERLYSYNIATELPSKLITPHCRCRTLLFLISSDSSLLFRGLRP
jgi:hypothetical protein